MAALPTFITTAEAAHQLGVSESRLGRMIKDGAIKAATFSGKMVVCESSIREITPKEQLPEYIKHAHLKNIPIGISEASRKYDIPNPTIGRWVSKGIIMRLGTEKNKVLIDQADMAYCAEIYHNHRGQGKWLFNTDGTPYVPRAEKVYIPA